MTNGEGLSEWLKWITGGIIGGLALFWQWMERKIDKLSDRIDALRENVRHDRHAMDNKYQDIVGDIDKDIDALKDRVTRIESERK